MSSTIGEYSPEASYMIYKLWRGNYVGSNQMKETGLKTICRSSSAAAFGLTDAEADEMLEKLQRDNVIQKYQSGRKAWSLNKKFVSDHQDELEAMQEERSGVSRIMDSG